MRGIIQPAGFYGNAMLEHLINIPYCYHYLVNQISIGLLLYAHLPGAIAAFLFGLFMLCRTRRLIGWLLFLVCACFAIWCLTDLVSWFAFLGSQTMMFSWSLADIFSALFFFFAYYFLYVFIHDRDLPLWQKIVLLAAFAPILAWVLTGARLTGYTAATCEALENDAATNYSSYLELAVLLATVALTAIAYRRAKVREQKTKIILASTGVALFLFIFYFAEVLTNVILDLNLFPYAYNFEIYGLFGMPVMLIFLGYLIVKYQAFDLRIFTAQGMSVLLITIVASLFAFLHDPASLVLNALNLIFVSALSVYLIRNVRREIDHAREIEQLATRLAQVNDELASANAGQENLIHVMNHQIKGYLAKDRGVFSELLADRAYGTLATNERAMIEGALESSTKGLHFVEGILQGSSAQRGTLPYHMESVDFRELLTRVVDSEKKPATDKGLVLSLHVADGKDYAMTGDPSHLFEAVRNLIENSIIYTPQGNVAVSLDRVGDMFSLAVKDTGIGIAEEDKARLFTQGGRGHDSAKINVDSTGYGLVFVKAVAEAHHGSVRADSPGPGKGSTFTLELPMRQSNDGGNKTT